MAKFDKNTLFLVTSSLSLNKYFCEFYHINNIKADKMICQRYQQSDIPMINMGFNDIKALSILKNYIPDDKMLILLNSSISNFYFNLDISNEEINNFYNAKFKPNYSHYIDIYNDWLMLNEETYRPLKYYYLKAKKNV